MSKKISAETCAKFRRELKIIGPKPGYDPIEFIDQVNKLPDSSIERLAQIFENLKKRKGG